MFLGPHKMKMSHYFSVSGTLWQAVLIAGDVETLSPGNHEKVTGNVNENPRVIK